MVEGKCIVRHFSRETKIEKKKKGDRQRERERNRVSLYVVLEEGKALQSSQQTRSKTHVVQNRSVFTGVSTSTRIFDSYLPCKLVHLRAYVVRSKVVCPFIPTRGKPRKRSSHEPPAYGRVIEFDSTSRETAATYSSHDLGNDRFVNNLQPVKYSAEYTVHWDYNLTRFCSEFVKVFQKIKNFYLSN